MQFSAGILFGQLLLWVIGAVGPTRVVDRETIAMGTRLRAVVEANSEEAAHEAIERVFTRVAAVEARLSSWSPDSELSLVNGAPLRSATALSTELSRWLERARALEQHTSSAFSMTPGALVDAWDLRGSGRRPSPEEIKFALIHSSPGCFDMSGGAKIVTRLCTDAWIDAGAFGKGVALDEAAGVLEKSGIAAATLDFGGQLLVVGTRADVSIAHPTDRSKPVATWHAVSGALATTSQSERTLAHDDGPIGHVLDPSSGQPVPAWGSVTVRSNDGVRADALATALFVMGPDEGVRWIDDRRDVSAVFLVRTQDGLIACGTAEAIEQLTVTETQSVSIGIRNGSVFTCSSDEMKSGER